MIFAKISEKNQISKDKILNLAIRNGAIYAMKRLCITKYNNRHGKNNLPFIMNEIDINIDSNIFSNASL